MRTLVIDAPEATILEVSRLLETPEASGAGLRGLPVAVRPGHPLLSERGRVRHDDRGNAYRETLILAPETIVIVRLVEGELVAETNYGRQCFWPKRERVVAAEVPA